MPAVAPILGAVAGGLAGAAIPALGVAAGAGLGMTLGGAMSSQGSINSATQQQIAASQNATQLQANQFNLVRQLLQPYVAAGTGALGQTQGLLGLNGAANQQYQLQQLQNMPYFRGLVQQGEDAILQNASATGGLRGGNTQAALAQFRPQMLSQAYQQQLQNLGGLVSIGQNAAAGVGNAGANFADNVGSLYGRMGQIQANQQVASANLTNNVIDRMSGYLGALNPIAPQINTAGQAATIARGTGVGTGPGSLFGGLF